MSGGARIPGTDRKFLRTVQRSGVRVEVLTGNPIAVARTCLVLRRKYPGIPVIHGSGLRSIYPHAHFLARYIREVRPQVLVSALPGPNAVAICAAELTDRAVPVVVTVHNNIAADYPPEWLAASRTLYPLADAVVAVSRGVAESARRSLGVDAGRVRTIYIPIPADGIQRLAQEEVTHPWFADGEPPVILSVGREAPQKDYPTLVEAFGLARREVDSRLVILGRLSASYRARLKSLARGHGVEGDLDFVDFDENPYRYMRRAGVFALSSRWEGLPGGDPRGAGLRHAGGQYRHALWSARNPRGLGRPAAGGRRAGAGAGAGGDAAGARDRRRRRCGRAPPTSPKTRPPTPMLRCSRNWWGDARGELEQAPCRLPADECVRGRSGAQYSPLGSGAHCTRGTRADLVVPRLAGDYRAAIPDGDACLAGADSRHRQGAPAGRAAVRSRCGGDDRESFRGRPGLGWRWAGRVSTCPLESVSVSMRMPP